jgi:spore coat protein CotH
VSIHPVNDAMKKFALLVAVLCIWSVRFASGQLPGQSLFDNSRIHEIKITSVYESMVDTLTANYVLSFGLGQMQLREIPYAPALLSIDGTAMDTLGIRYKGFNSWWSSVKKPIKVDIDKYRKDQKYDGLVKFNLHNGSGDPTFIRENTIYKMLRCVGIKAPRTAYAKVYIDTTYIGLYRIVEQVDNTFLDLNFGNHDGNLYAQQSKGSAGFSLSWLGDAQENYYPSLALENHQKQNDWSALIHFLDVLNNTPDATFRNEILSVFEVDDFINII